jgi:hypothetical protein
LRLTVSQSVCLGVEPLLGLMTRYLFICMKVAVVSIWPALSDERSGLSLSQAIAAASHYITIAPIAYRTPLPSHSIVGCYVSVF